MRSIYHKNAKLDPPPSITAVVALIVIKQLLHWWSPSDRCSLALLRGILMIYGHGGCKFKHHLAGINVTTRKGGCVGSQFLYLFKAKRIKRNYKMVYGTPYRVQLWLGWSPGRLPWSFRAHINYILCTSIASSHCCNLRKVRNRLAQVSPLIFLLVDGWPLPRVGTIQYWKPRHIVRVLCELENWL